LKGNKPIDIPQSGLVGDFKDIDTAFKVALKSLLNSRSLNNSKAWKIVNVNDIYMNLQLVQNTLARHYDVYEKGLESE
tara:strand:+ start:276 stop:509 length:234 start_codon:yes stop_codon:yes gene_type:complete